MSEVEIYERVRKFYFTRPSLYSPFPLTDLRKVDQKLKKAFPVSYDPRKYFFYYQKNGKVAITHCTSKEALEIDAKGRFRTRKSILTFLNVVGKEPVKYFLCTEGKKVLAESHFINDFKRFYNLKQFAGKLYIIHN